MNQWPPITRRELHPTLDAISGTSTPAHEHALLSARACADGPGRRSHSVTAARWPASAPDQGPHRRAGHKSRQQDRLDPGLLAGLRARYDKAIDSGIVHNRHRDWHDGNHPGYTLATWLKTYAGQVWHFTRHLNVDWTSNVAERGVKPAERHQAVSGYWQTHATLNRWCLINSYLTTTRNHGLTVLDAITRALTSQPWLSTPATAA
jgi:hypothetical protein